MGKPIPIMAGIYVNGDPAVGVRYPLNLVPVMGQEGVADGHLRPAEGVAPLTTGQGEDRAGIVWTGAGLDVHYRVSGSKLISVPASGPPVVLGDVGGTGAARLDFSFDRLGILSGGFLWFYTVAGGLIKQTNPNIPANLIDMCWVDGYWVVTDGTDIAVSELASPPTFNPAKFGTTDRPDPVKALLKIVNELHVVSRNSIDVFRNTGGSGFPFTRVNGAYITKGAVGRLGACIFADTVAFVGNGRNDRPSVYMGRNGQSIRIGTTEIDRLIGACTPAQQTAISMDAIFDKGAQLLFVHLPDRTMVYDRIASLAAEQPMWHTRTSGLAEFGQYRARNMTLANNLWVVGDPQSSAIGTWTDTDSQHYGQLTRWEVYTLMLRVPGMGATMHSLELLALTGIVTPGTDPRISTAYTSNGRTFSQERYIRSGALGELSKKLEWNRLGMWRGYRVQRIRGDSNSRLSLLALDASISPLRRAA